jgi:hypothetical protein
MDDEQPGHDHSDEHTLPAEDPTLRQGHKPPRPSGKREQPATTRAAEPPMDRPAAGVARSLADLRALMNEVAAAGRAVPPTHYLLVTVDAGRRADEAVLGWLAQRDGQEELVGELAPPALGRSNENKIVVAFPGGERVSSLLGGTYFPLIVPGGTASGVPMISLVPELPLTIAGPSAGPSAAPAGPLW